MVLHRQQLALFQGKVLVELKLRESNLLQLADEPLKVLGWHGGLQVLDHLIHLVHLPLCAAQLVLKSPHTALILLLVSHQLLVVARKLLFFFDKCFDLKDKLLLLLHKSIKLNLDFVILSL